MKEINQYCDEQIAKYDALLEPYYAKYNCPKSFDLIDLNIFTEDDRKVFLEYHYSRKTIIEVLRKSFDLYSGPLSTGDEDLDKKRKAIFSSSNVVFERASRQHAVKWDTMDSIPSQRHMDNVAQCIMANELEMAAFGISYLIYQKRFEATNRADKKLKDLFSEPQDAAISSP